MLEKVLSRTAALIAAASASPAASALTVRAPCAARESRRIAASASTLAVASATSISPAWVSSSTAKRAGTLASNGNHVQQAFAESVDGLDLEAARRFDRAGEEAAGEAICSRVGALALEFGQFRVRGVVVERHPSPEPLEHADRHVGGRRLGEGQTENASWRRARRAAAARPGR